MKKLEPQNYKKLKQGQTITIVPGKVVTYETEKDGKTVKIQKLVSGESEIVKLIRISSKRKEVIDPDTKKGTGKFYHISDVIVYEPLKETFITIESTNDGIPFTNDVKLYYTTIICGMFEIYE